MRRGFVPIVLVVVLGSASTAAASGYRISEQSLNSSALSSAYVANAQGADAAYFNPARMADAPGGWQVEGGLSLIFLPSIEYDDARSSALSGESETGIFVIPNFFMVSPEYGNFRFGFATVSPAGLSKEWEDPFPATFAEKNSLTVAEANPSIAYRFSDAVAAGIGVRLIYADATVRSAGPIVALPGGGSSGGPASDEYVTIARDMDGDAVEFAFNLALAVKPVDNLVVGATYRSEVDLGLEGAGTLTASESFPNGLIPGGVYRGGGSVSIPIPAVLAVGIAYTFDRTTVEVVYDRTFWSAYDELDFKYDSALGNPILDLAFDASIEKDWDDADAYRIGVVHRWSDRLTLMGAAGVDGNPIPDRSLSFDLPDSDAWFASFGFRYDHGERFSYGVAYLHAHRKDRAARNETIAGTFSGAATHLLACTLTLRF